MVQSSVNVSVSQRLPPPPDGHAHVMCVAKCMRDRRGWMDGWMNVWIDGWCLVLGRFEYQSTLYGSRRQRMFRMQMKDNIYNICIYRIYTLRGVLLKYSALHDDAWGGDVRSHEGR